MIVALGPALGSIPIGTLRLVVGALLLVFGLQWLRKAILRASGYKALHDEDAIYTREVEQARSAKLERRAGLDWYAFMISFKGVLLEGLEVVFIVITFGSTQLALGLATAAACARSCSSLRSGSWCMRRSAGCPRTPSSSGSE